MVERKYRQQGYRDQGPPASRPRPPAARPSPAEAPRGGGMLERRTVSRCGACGSILPVATATLERCPSCQAAIRACRQCAHFDTGRRFECTQPLIERVADKSARNDCTAFTLRVTVERDASPDSAPPSEVRRAFDNLFKK